MPLEFKTMQSAKVDDPKTERVIRDLREAVKELQTQLRAIELRVVALE